MEHYGNLAYDYPPEPETRTERPKRQITGKRKEKRSAMASKKINIQRMAAILTLALSAGYMISQFVAVHESRKEISVLEEQLRAAEAVTSQKAFELERSVDLSEIEKEATTRLGMQRPEKHQIIYINVPMDDVTDTTADSVEGMDNSVKSFFNKILGNIVEFFSIK